MSTPDSPIYLFTYSPNEITRNPTYSFMNQLNDYFWSWHKCMKEFEVNPEFNQNGNLHYHGYFIIKDKVKWYKVVLPKMKYNGLIKINVVKDDFNKAIEYSRKDREIMKQIIDHPIPFTHKDIVKHIPPEYRPLQRTIREHFDDPVIIKNNKVVMTRINIPKIWNSNIPLARELEDSIITEVTEEIGRELPKRFSSNLEDGIEDIVLNE